MRMGIRKDGQVMGNMGKVGKMVNMGNMVNMVMAATIQVLMKTETGRSTEAKIDIWEGGGLEKDAKARVRRETLKGELNIKFL